MLIPCKESPMKTEFKKKITTVKTYVLLFYASFS